MGGVVGRYYVALAGGDGIVKNLVTLGSPHRLQARHQARGRAAADPPPTHTIVTTIWSRADALVPGTRQKPLPGAEVILYDDLGHVTLLGSRRVAGEIIARLSR